MQQLSHDGAPPQSAIPAVRLVPWRRLFGYLKPHKWRMLFAIVGLVISSGVSLVFPLFIGQTVTDILNQGVAGFVPGVAVRFADKEDGKQETQYSKDDPGVKGHGPQAVGRGQIAGRQGRQGNGQVTRKFVEAHGQPALLGTNQVHLHNHRRRPAQPLIDAQQHIGKDHPAPTGGQNDQEWHGQPGQPAGN